MKHPEYHLQAQICTYCDMQYPNLLYMSDTIASVNLNDRQAKRNSKIQKKGFKCPDLIIFEPKGIYHGLFIELKVKSPFKLNGELKKDIHLEGQAATIKALSAKGYCATFATGFDEAKQVIDNYMNDKRLCDCWLTVGSCKCEISK
jgi:hypothetical protein